MRSAQVRPDGSRIRWAELHEGAPGPARVYLHGLGASSAPYYAGVLTHPALAGRRSLLMDLLGFGISDRPADAGYTMEDHAGWVASAIRAAGAGPAEIVAHSMGGTMAVVLADRHPDVVAGLVVVDSSLDPITPVLVPGSSGIATYTEADFLAHGIGETLARVGEHWASTMRLAAPVALYRSAVSLTKTGVRDRLRNLTIPRAFVYPAEDGALPGEAELVASGVRVRAVADSGHNIMLDNPEAFANAVSATFIA
ncbi:alpha/beta fold hydrolase [Longispora albida]|uniref:alpha/beta fold hydrolase n=1 Tax=Longispora albida TaxID=203523 RepID=UPI00036C7E7C|nr:alpha/beta hydrolase [Longispora albida]